jgi:DNA-binding NtrC family response regulator
MSDLDREKEKEDAMKPTILLVDDEPKVIESLKRGLRKEPYHLLFALNGIDALNILQNTFIDVVVSDERMPGMDGSTLLARVRRCFPDTVRIMLTGSADVTSAMNAIYDGWVYQYLHKPCDASELASAIHNGLLLRSLRFSDEGPHIVMSSEEQDALLSYVSNPEQHL